MPSFYLDNLSKVFGSLTAIDNITLEARAGELLVILGPTGAGKTTLLRTLAGLEKPTAGAIRQDGADITRLSPAQRDMAMVFQNFSLYPRLSVYDNLAFGLRPAWRGIAPEEIERRVKWAAGLLGLNEKLSARPTELSGGQQQRVAIGRAIVREPKLFLFDEPLASLDAKLRESMTIELHRLQRRLAVTMLYVTHDQSEAMALADRIAVMDKGKLLQVGTPREIYSKPLTPRVAQLLGSPQINLLTRSQMSFCFPKVPLDPAASCFGIRPENLHVTANVASAFVLKVIEHLGPMTLVHAKVEGMQDMGGAENNLEIRMTLGPGIEMQVGNRVGIGVNADDVLTWPA